MTSNLRIEYATENDIARLMELVVPAFEYIPFSIMVGDVNTSEGHLSAGEHRIAAWKEHLTQSSHPSCIKCIYSDPETGEETIVSTAEWVVYDRPRTEEEYTKASYLMRADWIEDAKKREEVQQWIKPVTDTRIRWFGPKPHAELHFMCTDPNWQRKGSATKCVQFGLDRCKELGIPAYLEASNAGAPVYERMGFEVVDRVAFPLENGEGSDMPAMIWWPEGTRAVDKRPALPGFGR